VLTILAAAAVLVTVVVGPDLLDIYRLRQYLTSAAEAYETDRGGPWPQVVDACAPCHGPNGNSINQAYPVLAAQRSIYLTEQLRNFASGQRVNPIMNAMARSLKESEFSALAEYFARQIPSEARFFEPDERLRQKGEKIVTARDCAACHGNGLMGKDQFPRLAGQGYEYLLKQLNGFADGTRRDPGNTMNQLAFSWSAEERQAIATFLANHPVSGGGRSTVAQ
jgi:cytochrome c553